MCDLYLVWKIKAVLTHGCSPHSWLQSSLVVAVLTCGCSPHLWLQSSLVVAVLTRGCSPHLWLQSSLVVAVLTRGCSPQCHLLAQLSHLHCVQNYHMYCTMLYSGITMYMYVYTYITNIFWHCKKKSGKMQ